MTESAMSKNREPLRLLLLCDFEKRTAGTIVDHIFGLKKISVNSIQELSFRGEIPETLKLEKFDGVIIHYSLVACLDTYIGPSTRARLRRYRGLKFAFVQDDYRFINRTVDALRDLGIHVLFGFAPPDIIDEVYSPAKLPGAIRETVLAGYVPEHLTTRKVLPLRDRPIDIGYRARKLPAWLGSHGQEKWIVADRVLRDAARFGLKSDISTREEDRIYGEKWVKFVSSCKAFIGAESGSGVCDFTGEIQRCVEEHVAAFPDTPFETLRDLYFKAEDGRLMMNVISPRCFEAAALRTLMILYEGHYSGRLLPWRHYVPLKKDHSNMSEVVGVLRDLERAQAIVDTAFREVALNPENSFAAMVRQVDNAIDRAFREEMVATEQPYSEAEFSNLVRGERLRRGIRKLIKKIIKMIFLMAAFAAGYVPRRTALAQEMAPQDLAGASGRPNALLGLHLRTLNAYLDPSRDRRCLVGTTHLDQSCVLPDQICAGTRVHVAQRAPAGHVAAPKSKL